MIVELGNHAAIGRVDDRPSVTYIHVPEADEQGLGGYSHVPGKISVQDFKAHHAEATMYRGGITQLPDHEALLAIVNAWPSQSSDRPAWVKATPHDAGLGLKDAAGDLEGFLREFFQCDQEKPPNVEELYHTRYGPPGSGPSLPPLTALYTDDGRVKSNLNDGGGSTGLSGTGTAAGSTTFTTDKTLTTNAWTGYRVYAYNGTKLVWGNIISNNNTGGASVLTIDRWYNVDTPGGAAGTTPSSGYYYLIADGGMVSAWFCGLSTSSGLAPAHGDHTLASEYTTAGGGCIRKICPYAQTSGVATRAITLIPVFTANGSDTLPSTFYGAAFFTSMVTGFGGAGGPMVFEDTMTQATVAAVGDNLTLTETVNGS